LKEITRSLGLERLALEEYPGLPDYLRAWWHGDPIPRPARSALHLDPPEPRAGTAWSDREFQDELVAAHRRWGGSRESLEHLQALREGAPCVISGQQPALLGGPLYSAYKLAGAVGLARALSQRWNRTVVPVYWCGADDSDFEEARSVWVRGDTGHPWQASLPAELLASGNMVGSVPGRGSVEIESSLIELFGTNTNPALRAVLRELPAEFDLGARVIAAFLRLFADAGLVVIDARSARLRELGRPFLQRYAGHHRELAQEVDQRGSRLEDAGFARPLHPTATRSGLFALREERRVKLEPPEFAAAFANGESLSPSVLLRAPLQDELLAPVAAVLGPSELQYHAQLAPAYQILGVEAAAPAPRPHVCLLPSSLEFPDAPESRRQLLTGGEASREFLLAAAVPPEWESRTSRMQSALEGELERWRSTMENDAREDDLEGLRRRIQLGVDELRRKLRPRALDRDPARRQLVEWLPDWLSVRGVPQERAYASWLGWQWFGARFPVGMGELGSAYAHDLLEGTPSLYCTHLSLEA
jgi:hypothetical protein